jgi:aspartate/methionine/tyrosine aminotransferase
MALDNQEAIVAGQRERLHANLKVLEMFMASHEDCFHWQRPKGGSICFPGLRRAEGAHAFCRMLVEKAGIMLLPSAPFQYGDQHVRIGFGRQNLPEVLQRFDTYLSTIDR